MNNNSIQKERAMIIYSLRNRKKTVYEIAAIFKVSRQTVHEWMRMPSYKELSNLTTK